MCLLLYRDKYMATLQACWSLHVVIMFECLTARFACACILGKTSEEATSNSHPSRTEIMQSVGVSAIMRLFLVDWEVVLHGRSVEVTSCASPRYRICEIHHPHLRDSLPTTI